MLGFIVRVLKLLLKVLLVVSVIGFFIYFADAKPSHKQDEE